MFRRTRATALFLSTALAVGAVSAVTAPAAQAQDASFQITEDGITGLDTEDALTALTALSMLADTVNAAEPSNTPAPGSSDLQVVLDPLEALLSTISIVSSEDINLKDLVSTTQRMSPVRGQTADGATVVFPTSGRFTSGYGARWGTTHEGIDIADPIGTPVLTVMDGEVISAGGANGFGKWVRVRHDDGSISVYGHVHTINVSVGQRVTAGEQIATIGNEGRSTGPHLHFEISPGGGGAVDPVNWFSQQGIAVR